MGSRSGRVRSRSSNTPVDGAGAGRRSPRSWPSSRSPWRRASWACSRSGAIPKPSARRAENALARAVESDKATSGAVRDLVGLLATTVDAPQMLVSERFEKASHVVRDLTAKLRRHPVFATSNLVAICGLERQFAVDFRRRGNYAESRALLMDSLDLLEGRRSGAVDPDVDEAYARALMELGRVAHEQQRFDEALVCFQRAEEALEGMVRDPRQLEVIVSIDESRRAIASLLGRSGLEEPRRRLLESHIRMLERLSEHAGGDPAIGLLATLARLDLAAR